MNQLFFTSIFFAVSTAAKSRRKLRKEEEEDSNTLTIVLASSGGILILCILGCILQAYREHKQQIKDEAEEEEREERDCIEFQEVLRKHCEKLALDKIIAQKQQEMLAQEAMSYMAHSMSDFDGPPQNQQIGSTAININSQSMDQIERTPNQLDQDTKMTHGTHRSAIKGNMSHNGKKERVKDLFDDIEDLENLDDDQYKKKLEEMTSENPVDQQMPTCEGSPAPQQPKKDQDAVVQHIQTDIAIGLQATALNNQQFYPQQQWQHRRFEPRDDFAIGEQKDFDPYEGMSPRTKAVAKVKREAQIAELIKQMEAMDSSSDSDEKKKKKKKKKDKKKVQGKTPRGKKVKLYMMPEDDSTFQSRWEDDYPL